jgi:hypothetical protein
MPPPPVIIRHNFVPDDFMWLWAKYVVGFNELYHCTNCLRGRYSSRFSKARNPGLVNDRTITFDEHAGHQVIYICGVARNGYSSKKNYEHNVHLAIRPSPGRTSFFAFEDWQVEAEDGEVLSIPGTDDLDHRFRQLSPAFTTCRIFRWAACYDFDDRSP